MTKYEFNHAQKEIRKIEEMLKEDLCPHDHKKLFRRKAGLQLYCDNYTAKNYGVIL